MRYDFTKKAGLWLASQYERLYFTLCSELNGYFNSPASSLRCQDHLIIKYAQTITKLRRLDSKDLYLVSRLFGLNNVDQSKDSSSKQQIEQFR